MNISNPFRSAIKPASMREQYLADRARFVGRVSFIVGVILGAVVGYIV